MIDAFKTAGNSPPSTTNCRSKSPSTNLTAPSARLMRINTAAQYAACTTWFIRSLLWSGALPYIKLGKRFCIDQRDLDAYLDSVKTGGTR